MSLKERVRMKIMAGGVKANELSQVQAAELMGFEDEAAGFGVNRDPGKAGEKAVAKQAGFAGEDRVLVEARGYVVESVKADFNRCFGLRD